MPPEIIKEILKDLPDKKISDAVFEGANIVLYTKDKAFFLDDGGIVKEAVNKIKKRIELRPDPSIAMEMEKAEKEIRKIIPEDSGLGQVIFDPRRSIVNIEVEKPGVAIGKQGENLRDIRKKTSWVPMIKRTPPIRSQLIENIRAVLYQNSDERRRFLNRTGDRIYNGWTRGKRDEWVRVSILGAGRQVGRSCLLLQTPESRILLDCGIDPSRNDEAAYPHLEAPEFKIDELDAVIITHAHLDHCGLVPYLYKFGYKGPIYCTEPTRDIMALLQIDFVKIQKNEGKDPIYEVEHIENMVKHTICLEYEEVTDITPDVRITMYNAGHTLGSALIHIHVGNGLHNLVYTGDLKYGMSALLAPSATQFPRLETLIIEGTYGGKDNIVNEQEADQHLKDLIIKTVKDGGKILVPVIGSGRGQEIMMMVEELVRTKQIDKIPVYIDGMVWDITAIHTAYPEFLNSNMRKMIFHKDENPFLSDIFRRVASQKERQEIIDSAEPCVILATSGMLNGGPSVQYFKNLCENKKNLLVFSSYQGEGTLGRRIQNGEREIAFRDGNTKGGQTIYKVNMEVAKIEVTGHADRRQLMNYVQKCNPRPKKVIVVHGEVTRCIDFASSVHKAMRSETITPRNLEVLRLR